MTNTSSNEVGGFDPWKLFNNWNLKTSNWAFVIHFFGEISLHLSVFRNNALNFAVLHFSEVCRQRFTILTSSIKLVFGLKLLWNSLRKSAFLFTLQSSFTSTVTVQRISFQLVVLGGSYSIKMCSTTRQWRKREKQQNYSLHVHFWEFRYCRHFKIIIHLNKE